VTGDRQYVVPSNVAAAVNAGCSSCGTFAYAWQYVLHVDAPTHLSATALLQEHELEQRIATTAAATQPASLADDQELKARLDELTNELRDLVEHEIALGDVKPSGPPTLRSHVASEPPAQGT
jgi:hypothetical protein